MFSASKKPLYEPVSPEWSKRILCKPHATKKNQKILKKKMGALLCFTNALVLWLKVQDSWAMRRGKMDSGLAWGWVGRTDILGIQVHRQNRPV